MQVILTQSVEKVGRQGDVVEVAKGFARNYLIPRGLAVVADTKKVRHLEHRKKIIADKSRRELKEIEALIGKLEQMSLTIPVQVGEEDRIFGSVTSGDIAKSLESQGISLDRRKIHVEEPIKALGVYTVQVKLETDKVAHLKVWVVKNKE